MLVPSNATRPFLCMKYLFLFFCLCTLLFSANAQQRFEPEIRRFEILDSISRPDTGQILLYGSSTMRLWKTFSQDIDGYKVVNRGFGGSEMSDAIYFFDRGVLPLKPSLILLYEGDNDLSNSKKTPDQVLRDFNSFMSLVAEKLPQTRVAVFSLRPSLAREKLMPEQRIVNEGYKKYCEAHAKKAFYIDLYQTLLTETGAPNGEYLATDLLHLNEKGYAVWAKATRDFLQSLNKR